MSRNTLRDPGSGCIHRLPCRSGVTSRCLHRLVSKELPYHRQTLPESQRAKRRNAKRVVETLAVERGDRVFYDSDLTGFAVRVHATGRKVYVVHARAPGGALKHASIGQKVDMGGVWPRRSSTR